MVGNNSQAQALKRQRVYKGEDRITNLPDEILQHILSFLPTKQAAATSILSSKWKYFWTSVPVLDFVDIESLYSKTIQRKRKTKLVDVVLQLHQRSNVRKFSLSYNCPNCADEGKALYRLSSWLTTAILRCKLEELTLHVPNGPWHDMPFVFPRCVFMPESLMRLTTLKIDMICLLRTPDSVHFPKLKVLNLHTVIFSAECLDKEVLFDFPTLEECFMDSFDATNIRTLTISAPKLITLHISNVVSHLEYTYRNDIYEDSYCKVKVHAERVVSLRIGIHSNYDYSLESLPSLINAHVDFLEFFRPVSDAQVINLLKTISSVKELKLEVSDEVLEGLHGGDHSAPPLTLPYLTHLTLISTKEVSECLSFRLLISLLHMLPNLEALFIADKTRINGEVGWTPPQMPQCLLSHLKSVTFEDFNGNPDDLNVVSFVLKNARVLQGMTIVASQDFWENHKQVDVTKQLLMIPRVSPQCMINLS